VELLDVGEAPLSTLRLISTPDQDLEVGLVQPLAERTHVTLLMNLDEIEGIDVSWLLVIIIQERQRIV